MAIRRYDARDMIREAGSSTYPTNDADKYSLRIQSNFVICYMAFSGCVDRQISDEDDCRVVLADCNVGKRISQEPKRALAGQEKSGRSGSTYGRGLSLNST